MMKFLFGIVIMTMAYVLSLIFIFSTLIFYVIPVYLLGAALIWLTKKKVWVKCLITLLPVILWIPFVQLYFSLAIKFDKTHQKIDFFVSEEFRGNVICVNFAPCADSVYEVKGREQIDIPSDGILLYPEKMDIGETYTRFFIRQNDEVLPVYISWTMKGKKVLRKDSTAIQIHSISRGGITTTIDNEEKSFVTTSFYIGSNSMFKKFLNTSNKSKRQVETIDSLLIDCLESDKSSN